MKAFFIALAMLAMATVNGQGKRMILEKSNAATPIKNQGRTGTCWSFSTTSLVESECLRKGMPAIDLSEMFTVRNIYMEKAKNYIRRQGSARFDEGGLGHDVIRSMARYGIVPESAYSGLKAQAQLHNHSVMVGVLKNYLDSILKIKAPIPENWAIQFSAILDEYMGKAPTDFEYNGKTYTPLTFAKEVVKFDANDYVSLTSFTHHPFYQPFIVEVPDNFSNGAYYNLPLDELTQVTKAALKKGYTILWDTDVSNNGWAASKGYAVLPPADNAFEKDSINPDMTEGNYSQDTRQRLYEELVTEDDHLMHITGIEKTPQGKTFFIVKNSWGLKSSPFEGYVHVSEPYFAINTVTVIVPKSALDKSLRNKIAASM
ncbi:C1 family peptidase [Chitinophaga sp. MM2321]|uniref:C1 family peptidase n=1 Tax=Chitinophaga sp. MM2321 TaxID=3137178 RepID=UPI0032D56872